MQRESFFAVRPWGGCIELYCSRTLGKLPSASVSPLPCCVSRRAVLRTCGCSTRRTRPSPPSKKLRGTRRRFYFTPRPAHFIRVYWCCYGWTVTTGRCGLAERLSVALFKSAVFVLIYALRERESRGLRTAVEQRPHVEPAGKTHVERGREAVYAEVFELTAAPMSSQPIASASSVVVRLSSRLFIRFSSASQVTKTLFFIISKVSPQLSSASPERRLPT